MKTQDSKTVDVMTVEGRRDRVTVRVKPQLKKALKRFCRANGLSICHVFETLVTGYLVGVNQKINLDVKRPTINLTVVRDVKRVRRYGTLSNDPRIEEVVEDSGSFSSCSLCDKRPMIVVFYHPSRSVCQRVFYCQNHWQEHKTRGSFDGYRRL
jgi:hypothetical protein